MSMISDEKTIEEGKYGELIYLSALLCDKLYELEKKFDNELSSVVLKRKFQYDTDLKFLIDIRNRLGKVILTHKV